MSIGALFRFAQRTHVLVLPVLVLLLLGVLFLVFWQNVDQAALLALMPRAQIGGTALMFCLLPAYLLLMMCVQHRVTLEVLEAVRAAAQTEDAAAVTAQLDRIGAGTILLIPLGAMFGLWQNSYIIDALRDGTAIAPLDVLFVSANCLLWALVALLLGWRIGVSRKLSALTLRMDVNLYRLDLLRPLARIATTDVLAVAGAMALMPLQSLDASFRLWNYQWGLAVGVPAVVVLFLLPLWGLRSRIAGMKQQRLTELRAHYQQLGSDDIAQLELHSAHIDRVAGLANWPIDLKIVTRIFAYGIIPPLAWVAAALVENLVERLQ